MKVLGKIFFVLILVVGGIVLAKTGLFDQFVEIVKGFFNRN